MRSHALAPLQDAEALPKYLAWPVDRIGPRVSLAAEAGHALLLPSRTSHAEWEAAMRAWNAAPNEPAPRGLAVPLHFIAKATFSRYV